MSMILEALRKSEAERQRGRAPGLFVEQLPARGRERRVPVWAWALGAALVAVLLAWGWREWRRPAMVIVTTAQPAADTVAEARPTQIAERMEPAPGGPGAMAPITLEPGAPAALPAPASAPAPAIADSLPAPARTPTASAAAAPPRPEAIGGPAPAPEPAPVAPVAPAATLLGLESLSAADRSTLPPLKLSMHVYADAPAQRFVILDGQRLGEGASPAGGVVLEEIRRDGLVLSVNGRRLLLARP